MCKSQSHTKNFTGRVRGRRVKVLCKSRRTRDSPYKCLISKFPKTPHFCPYKISEIWAFLTDMTPDLPAQGIRRETLGFFKPTRACENPHPHVRVWVLTGTGQGSYKTHGNQIPYRLGMRVCIMNIAATNYQYLQPCKMRLYTVHQIVSQS